MVVGVDVAAAVEVKSVGLRRSVEGSLPMLGNCVVVFWEGEVDLVRTRRRIGGRDGANGLSLGRGRDSGGWWFFCPPGFLDRKSVV